MTTAEAAAALVTNRHARAALGIAADNLRRGYEVIATIKPYSWDPNLSAIGSVFGAGSGDADVRQQATDLLDRANAYASGLYATIADSDDALSEAMRARVAVALSTAESDLKLLETVQAALVETFLGDLGDLVENIAQATIASTQWIADKAKAIVAAVVPQWVWWVLGGAAIVAAGVYAARLSPRVSA